MDKEFEEWISEQYRDSYHGYGRYDMEEAWSASKQHWLNKIINQRECYQRGFNAGIDKAVDECAYSGDIDNEVALAIDEIAEAIKELKE